MLWAYRARYTSQARTSSAAPRTVDVQFGLVSKDTREELLPVSYNSSWFLVFVYLPGWNVRYVSDYLLISCYFIDYLRRAQ